MAYSFLKKLDLYPPVRCRLVAVHYPNGPKKWPVPLSNEQIVQGTNLELSHAEVAYLSSLTSWDDVPLRKIKLFLKGCRLKFENWGAFKRIGRLANRGKFFYLRRDDNWEPVFSQLVEIWEKQNAGG